MDINDLTLGQIKDLHKIFGDSNNTDIASHYIGKQCIFRTYSAGVFFGILKARNGKDVIIKECRRIFYWEGAFTLSKIAESGVSSAKLSVEEPEKLCTECIEVIPASSKCIKQLKSMEAHSA